MHANAWSNDMLARILALVVKEFLALLKDKRSRIVLIVPPLIQLMVFGYAATFDLKNVPFAVYNEDSGAASRHILAAFNGSPSFTKVAQLTRESEIAPLIDAKNVLMVVHAGPNFSADLLGGRPAALQVIVDGRNSNTAMLAINDVSVMVDRFNREWAASHDGNLPPSHIETRAWFNPNLESRWFFLPGIVGILTLLVTMLVTALSVAREREQGTFDQLLVTPLRPVEILIGKILPGFLIGLTEASVIMLAAVFWFKVPLLGSLLTLYTGIVLFLLSGVGVGLMISSFAVTQQQGLLGAFIFMVPSIILSGFATPIRNMPQLVQDITLINPMRYFMVVLRGVFLEGMPFHLLIHQFWPMALIGVVALSIAGWLFRHRMY
jgi:ABC-2 type transport system permease protein